MASSISFQGLSTNLPTDQLVAAIMESESQGLVRMQERQTANSKRTSLLRTLNANLLALRSTLGDLNYSGFTARTVTSSDSNSTYVSGSASGAAAGTYEVVVSQAAKSARLISASSVASSSENLNSSGTGGGTYTLKNLDGESTTITLTEDKNNLAGLRDAINAQSEDTGLAATLVQTGADGTAYKLVLTATETGLGTAATNNDTLYLKAGEANKLGLSTSGDGSAGAEKALNALFSVNGLTMERRSNTVTDAVEGLTLSLKKGDTTNTVTTLTVATDKDSMTKSMQAVVDKFNAIYKVYKDNSGSGGALANDSSLRTMISQVRSAIMSVPEGMEDGTSFRSAADVGLKTSRDGTLALDSTVFKKTLDTDPNTIASIFDKVGTRMLDLVGQLTSPGSGNIAQIIQSVDRQNNFLSQQITTTQARLDRRKLALEAQFASLESTVGQLQAMGQSLASL